MTRRVRFQTGGDVAGRSKKVARTERAGVDADALLATYTRWLKRQPLAPAVA